MCVGPIFSGSAVLVRMLEARGAYEHLHMCGSYLAGLRCWFACNHICDLFATGALCAQHDKEGYLFIYDSARANKVTTPGMAAKWTTTDEHLFAPDDTGVFAAIAISRDGKKMVAVRPPLHRENDGVSCVRRMFLPHTPHTTARHHRRGPAKVRRWAVYISQKTSLRTGVRVSPFR